MGLRDRLTRLWSVAGGEPRPDGLKELAIGDPAYDDWDVVRDFPEFETARAFQQALTDQGVEAVLTSDWPLDEWGRGGRGVDARARRPRAPQRLSRTRPAAASWPQAASMSRPRVSRTVALSPCSSSAERKASIAPREEPS